MKEKLYNLSDKSYSFMACIIICVLYYFTDEQRLLEILLVSFGVLFGLLKNGNTNTFINSDSDEIKNLLEKKII